MFKDKLNRLAEIVGFEVDADAALMKKIYALGVLINFERTRELTPLIKAVIQDEIEACASLCDDLDQPETARLMRARKQTLQVDGNSLTIRQLQLNANLSETQ